MSDRRVLVLGSNGMLGSAVCAWLATREDLEVESTCRPGDETGASGRPFDVATFANAPEKHGWLKDHDWIINCIGKLKVDGDGADVRGRQQAILVNAQFPHLLATILEGTRTRVVQIATDGVFSGRKGSYDEQDSHDAEDLYGRTKSLGEVPSPSFLHIRCSIVGPDSKRRRGLLEWLLSQREGAEVPGFTHHRWSGVTTLQFAELCYRVVSRNGLFDRLTGVSRVHHFIANGTCSKNDLLQTMNRVYGANLRIQPVVAPGPPVDRSLTSRFDALSDCYGTSSLEAALEALRSWKTAAPRTG